MTIIQKIRIGFRKRYNFLSNFDLKTLRIQKFNPIFLISFFIVFSAFFFISINIIDNKNKKHLNNFEEVAKSSELSNLTNFLISKLNSPYEEINYIIKNNDTVEKILKKFKIKEADIKNISVKLKKKKTY